jgi:hypothetical protein
MQDSQYHPSSLIIIQSDPTQDKPIPGLESIAKIEG